MCGAAACDPKSPATWPGCAELLAPVPPCGAAPLARGHSWHACGPLLGAPASSVEAELRLCGCVS